jgi:hypothetical protein
VSEPELAVRRYEPGDEVAIQAMYETVFGRARTLAEWRWRLREGPDGPALAYVLVSGDRLVGHQAHIPAHVWVRGERLRIGHGCDTMVVPEFRGRGGMRLLMEAFLSSDHGFDLRMSYPNEYSGGLMERYGGGRPLGALGHWARWSRRGSGLRGPARVVIGAASRAYGSLASMPRPRLEVEDLGEPGAEVDDLDADAAGFAPCVRVRDAAYVRWRWLEHPGPRWRLRAVRREGRLEGWVVYGAREERYGRVGLVADLLARDAATTRALVQDAFVTLAAEGCPSVTCQCVDPRSWAGRALLRSGFVRRPHGARVICGALSPRAGGGVERLESWYLTLGDTDMA